jgi:hypothetical protein
MSQEDKAAPFIKKFLGSRYTQVDFDSLTISTATINVKLVENAGIKYDAFFKLLQLDPERGKEVVQTPGEIFGARCENQTKGNPPTKAEKAIKNATIVWMWLKEKHINVKISRNNLHITGCKKLEQAAEAVRYVQMWLKHLSTPSFPLYENEPTAVKFEAHMITYNFTLNVAIDLELFDLFLYKKWSKKVSSPYDKNVAPTVMTMRCPSYGLTFTINDNGNISLCASNEDFDRAHVNLCEGYLMFYEMLQTYRAN